MILYMLIMLIMSCLQGSELKPFSCANHLRFIDFTSERCVRAFSVHSMNHKHAYLRDERKIIFRMVSMQHFINEAPSVFKINSKPV